GAISRLRLTTGLAPQCRQQRWYRQPRAPIERNSPTLLSCVRGASATAPLLAIEPRIGLSTHMGIGARPAGPCEWHRVDRAPGFLRDLEVDSGWSPNEDRRQALRFQVAP